MPDQEQPQQQPPDAPRPRFDERAALENLERLQRELEASRQRRKDASAAFDSFVGSFRKGPGAESRASGAPPQTRSPSPRFDSPIYTLPPVRSRRNSTPRIALIAGGVVAVAAGLLLTRPWRSSQSSGAALAPAAVTSPAPAGAPAARTPAPAAPDGGPYALPAELIAVKDVWVRATVDGERVLEREIEAGTRIPLRGSTIVIRAGNAAAVRIAVDGKDRGPLGAEGVVVTRTFTATTAGR